MAGVREKDENRKSFPTADRDFPKFRQGMSQSMTEHLNIEASSPRYPFKKSRSMKFAVKDEVEGDWLKVVTWCAFIGQFIFEHQPMALHCLGLSAEDQFSKDKSTT